MTNIYKQKIILSIIKFLETEGRCENFNAKEKEFMNIVTQCLETIYKIEPKVKNQIGASVLDLREIISADDSSIAQEAKSRAIAFKERGNVAMYNFKPNEALEEYTKAINVNPKNPVFYCNRAAVYNHLNQPINAIIDTKQALKLDPTYSKAYGRLGRAYALLGLNKEAHEAYIKAFKYDPKNQEYKESLKYVELSKEVGQNTLNDVLGNTSLVNLTLELMENDSFREMLENFTTSQTDPSCLNNLLQIGQMLVNKIQGPAPL